MGELELSYRWAEGLLGVSLQISRVKLIIGHYIKLQAPYSFKIKVFFPLST
jgi:hypothetical protein